MVNTYAIFSGFNYSMETSRTIRAGTPNYITRIAAVSHEYVLICLTRKVTRPENDMVLVFASKLTWFMWVVEIDGISVWGSESTWFQCRDQKLVLCGSRK